MRSYIVHQGEKFTIEWYYDEEGSCEARDYYDELPIEQKRKFDFLIRSMAERGVIHSTQKFRYEGDQIYAFKLQPDRFLCFFFKGSKIVITNAFEKKTDKLPKREKERALKYKDNYAQRVQGGLYYE